MNLWQRLVKADENTSNYNETLEILAGKCWKLENIYQWHPFTVSGQLSIIMSVDLDNSFLIGYLTLRAKISVKDTPKLIIETFSVLFSE